MYEVWKGIKRCNEMDDNKKDLTTGPLGKQILFFSIPLILSNLLQVLFNMADVAVVGRFAGPEALGSVGSTTILVTLFTGFLIGLAGGVNVLVALHVGAGNSREIKETVHTSLIVCFFMGVLVLLFGLGFSRSILQLMSTKEELIDGAVLYMNIYFLGMPALGVYNFGNAVFSAVGDTKRPVRYLAFSGVINIILNLLFVIVFQLSVAGVAIASVISQYISAALIVRALFGIKDDYGLRLKEIRIYRDKMKNILSLGLPAGVQNAIFQLANLFVQTGVNSFNAVVVEGNSAATNADALVYDVMNAFYIACASFMGQNYGARNKKRVRNSYLICLAYSFVIGLVIGVTLFCFGRQFLALFTGEAAVIDAGMLRLGIMSFSYGFSAFMDCSIAASRGLGKTVVPTIIVIMGSCVFRIIWIYTVFAYFKTVPSLYLLYIFSWSITAVAEIIYFVHVYRKAVADMT